MAVVNEGNGVTYTFSGIAFDPISLQVPGYSREMIDLTNLDNSAVRTKIGAALADWQPFVLRTAFDPDGVDGWPAGGEGSAFVVTFPGGANITIYAVASDVAPVELANNERPINEITFTPTNLNSGVETAPAYSAI